MKEVDNILQLENSQGLGAQKSELDQIMYAVNYFALDQLVSDVNNAKEYKENAIDSDHLLEEEMSEEYKQKIIADYEKNNPDKVLKDEDVSKLTFSTSQDERRQRSNNTDDNLDFIRNNIFMNKATFEDTKQNYIKLGMVAAKVNLAVGKEYNNWLDKLKTQNPDDPDCEAKAMYLAQNNTSGTFYLERGLSGAQKVITDESQYKFTRSTVLGEADNLKKMSMDELFDKAYVNKADRKKLIDNYAKLFPGTTSETKVYDLYKNVLLKRGHKEPIPNNDIQAAAMDDYYRHSVNNWTKMGSELVMANMSKEDRKLAEIGADLSSSFEMKYPDSIKNWIKTDAQKIIQDNKITGLNSGHKMLSDAVGVKKAYNLEKTDLYITKAIKPVGSEKDIDKYINKHSGLKAFSATPDEKKVHLAKLMSANTFKVKALSYNVGGIHNFANELMKREAFQKLSDYEVTKALASPENAVRLQKNIYVKTFGVANNKRQAYINEMMTLKENMMSTLKRSDEYKNLFNAVDTIAKLTPDDPGFYVANDKLIKAIRDYTKGKKSVRHDSEGQARFDNAMDALAIVDKYVPGSKNFVKEQVDRIRKVRGVKPGHKNYLDLKDYGAQNARNKKMARVEEAAAKKQVPKGLGM